MFYLRTKKINAKPLRQPETISSKGKSTTKLVRTLTQHSKTSSQHKPVIIIGNGIIAAMEAYAAYQNGQEVTVIGSNKRSNACRISASITPDIVMPFGSNLSTAIHIPYYQPDGIRIDDVPGVNDSMVTHRFIEKFSQYAQYEFSYQAKNQLLFNINHFSLLRWEQMVHEADPQLRTIFAKANFRPCHQPVTDFFDGYQIDLFHRDSDVQEKTAAMRYKYQLLGYSHCRILSPAEVLKQNPYLTDFCYKHSLLQQNQNEWLKTTSALYRPGGCIDADSFLPAFFDYLKSKMGTSTNSNGSKIDRFQLYLGKEVESVVFNQNKTSINGLQFSDKTYMANNIDCNYVFCPGENIGFLSRCGFIEPESVRFASVSLKLNIPVMSNQKDYFYKLNNWMEIHKKNFVLAWQARFISECNQIFIGITGANALYGNQLPLAEHGFAKNQHLFQLNTLNEVMPEIISMALERDTKGCILTEIDLIRLKMQGIATLDVCSQSVAYDGFPTLGSAYTKDKNIIKKVANGWINTHWSSRGISCAPAAAFFSQKAQQTDSLQKQDSLTTNTLLYSSSLR